MKRPQKAFLGELGAAIRRRRNAMGISQMELADRADITQKYLSEIESGRRNPSVDCARRICDGLQESMSGLFKKIEWTTGVSVTRPVRFHYSCDQLDFSRG
jgi:transcriptional regulator with XRE-family HTH domain